MSLKAKFEDHSRLLTALADLRLVSHVERPRIFIVHGHDETMLGELKDYLETKRDTLVNAFSKKKLCIIFFYENFDLFSKYARFTFNQKGVPSSDSHIL